MKQPPIPVNEEARLKSLREHQLLDTLPEDVYDEITRIASEICGTPISLLTLVDQNRQWFKSKHGMDISETPREHSFCAHALINPDEVFVVPDARYDERFHDNPFTVGEPKVVFYAGVPVKDEEGNALGTLCVIDDRPRMLTAAKVESLKALGKLIGTHFELRRLKIEVEENRNSFGQMRSVIDAVRRDAEALQGHQLESAQARHVANILQAVGSVKTSKGS